MAKIIVKNHDDEETDKLSVEELNARLKDSIKTEPDEITEEEIEDELKQNLEDPADDEQWLNEFGDEPDEKDAPSEPDNPEDTKVDEQELDDAELSQAVEDIEKTDSNELLQKQDEEIAGQEAVSTPKGLRAKISHYFKSWWNNKRLRNLTFLGIGIFVLAIMLIPTTRYFILNAFGVRATSSLTVLDLTTSQPLKNVTVELAGQSAQTGSDGKAYLSNLKLGPTQLYIHKTAFADVTQDMTIGLGSNPLGEFKLKATGAQYSFVVTDWLSGQPIEKVEASSGDASAVSDKDGKVVLTVPNPESETVEVQISYNNYRTEKVKINADDKSVQKISIVPARKHIFVSNRTGKFDVYKIDVDGKNEQVLLAGTGSERDDMVLMPQYDGGVVALVSTRENIRNKDGYLMSGLYMVDVKTGTTKKVVSSERIQPIQWIGKRLIYVTIAEGASAENPKRHRLMTYNLDENTNKEISATNYFNDVMVAAGRVYYAPSNAYNIDPANARLFVVNADGGNKQTILGQEVWNIFRSSYEKLSLATSTDWYSYKLGDSTAVKLGGPPSNQTSRLYVDNNDFTKSVWSEERDGKGTLLEYDIKSTKDKLLKSQAGIKAPYYWLSPSYIVYRLNSDTETADYVISTQGGEAKKIKDVSNIGGIDRWYYY